MHFPALVANNIDVLTLGASVSWWLFYYTTKAPRHQRSVHHSGRFPCARKWEKELAYKLKKELWGFRENRMAVRFEYEWHDSSGQWYRSYGNELWEFDDNGLMRKRFASINDLAIREPDRKLKR